MDTPKHFKATKIKYIFVGLMIILSLSGCAEKKQAELNVLNWGMYIDPTVVTDFEKEYGVKVNYDLFEQNEEMYTKVKAGGINYDIVFGGDYTFDVMRKEGLLEKIDKKNIPNYENIDKEFRNLDYDPDGEYTVPYLWGNIALIYDPEKVDKTVDSWDILWDKDYKGEINMLDSSRFDLAMAMIRLGYSPNSTDVSELTKAKDSLIEQKQYVRAYLGDDQAKDNMIAKDGSISMIYGGEAMLAIQERPELKFVYPKEGCILVFDAMAIPTTTQNKELAEKFLDFMCRPDIAARNAEVVQYATPISKARELLSDEFKNNEAIYPPEDVIKKAYTMQDLGEFNQEIDKAWTEIKSN